MEKVLVCAKENLSVLVHKSSCKYLNGIYVPSCYHAVILNIIYKGQHNIFS